MNRPARYWITEFEELRELILDLCIKVEDLQYMIHNMRREDQ